MAFSVSIIFRVIITYSCTQGTSTLTLGVIDVKNFKVESVSFLESLQTRRVDEVLYDVTLQQLSQSGRIVEDLVEFGTRNHGERLVGWSEHRIRSGCVINHTSGGRIERK